MVPFPWLWVPVTIGATMVQTVRTAAQKHLTAELTTISAAAVRFLFGLPFAAAYFLSLHHWNGYGMPNLSGEFVALVALAGFSQIIATSLLVYLFSLRNFAVGTTYARSEAFLTAVIGSLLFGEAIALFGWVGIFVSVTGVILMTIAKQGLKGAQVLVLLRDKAAWIGILSGVGFALSSLSMRRASLILGLDDFLYRAALVMITMLVIQAVVMTVYLALTNPSQFRIIARNWRVCVLVGITSMLGTACWATAFTLERAAYVKALSQVEFVFTLMVSIWFFKETTTSKELSGIVLVVCGIVLLTLWG